MVIFVPYEILWRSAIWGVSYFFQVSWEKKSFISSKMILGPVWLPWKDFPMTKLSQKFIFKLFDCHDKFFFFFMFFLWFFYFISLWDFLFFSTQFMATRLGLNVWGAVNDFAQWNSFNKSKWGMNQEKEERWEEHHRNGRKSRYL